MTSHRMPILLLSVPLTAVLACAADAPVAGCLPAPSGVETVANTGPSIWERRGVSPRLVELWRAGGTNEGEELAWPIGMAVSATGRIAIPDFELGEVAVVSPDGDWQGAWTWQGEGPGEVSTPVAATWGDDRTLAIFDIVNAKVVFLVDGEPARDDLPVDPSFTAPVVSSGGLAWAGVRADGTVYLQPLVREDPATGESVSVILRKRPGGAGIDTIARGVVRMFTGEGVGRMTVPGWPRPVAAIGGGRLVLAGEDARYRIRVFDRAGEPVRLICSSAPAPPLTPEEFELPADAELGTMAAPIEAALQDAPRPEEPAPFGRIFIDPDGRVWVQRDRPSLYGYDTYQGVPGATYHVFDADGRFLGELVAPPGVALQGALGDTVFAFERGEFDETWVVAYGLVLE